MTQEERNALATMIELGAVPELHSYRAGHRITYRFFVCGTYTATYVGPNHDLMVELNPPPGNSRSTPAPLWATALVNFLRG